MHPAALSLCDSWASCCYNLHPFAAPGDRVPIGAARTPPWYTPLLPPPE